AEVGADDLQHEVDRGGDAGAGVTLAVDLVDVSRTLDFREALAEACPVLPVDGAAVAVELAGFGQDQRAGRKPSERPPLAAPGAKGRQNLALAGKLGGQPHADKKDIGRG